jgi:hypothetical protein
MDSGNDWMNMARYEILELPVSGNRLGRHVNHDPRSFGFPFRVEEPRKLANTLWPRYSDILDQDGYGACVGFAVCGCAATGPVWDGLPPAHPVLDNAEGFKLYSQATELDPYPGSWDYRDPDGPNSEDTGSDGVSGMKAAVNNYLISGYTHTFDLNTALQAIMTTPVITGFNWYSSFDSPAADGTISISSGAYVRGGHEVLVRGISVGTANNYVLCDNSWNGWGFNGTFKFSFDTFERLLAENGDCTVPVPLHQPAPEPVPVIITTTGQSLRALSGNKGLPVSTILRRTLLQYKYFTSGMSSYLQNGNIDLALPLGEKLCIAWPQYAIG